MHGCRALITLLAATLIGLLAVAPSRAYIAPGALLVSASLDLREQGDDASSQPDLSSDGRYVVFTTAARNLFPSDIEDPKGEFYEGGLYRRDVAGGHLDLVALGGLRDATSGELLQRGAGNPSVSADGRFVVFSTGAALVPDDKNEHVDVYVRDMSLPRTDPRAYDLISALDGSAQPARYGPRTPPAPFRDPGADVAPGVAISDDGSKVVFEVAAVPTSLPDHADVDVPPGQVFVRDRERRETRLITRVAGETPSRPVSNGDFAVGVGPAVISADGTTVAWAGQQAQQQTRFLPNEGQDGAIYFYLSQRIADGPNAPTRRITGAVDLDDPACRGDYVPSPAATGPCYGPLADTEQGLAGIAATPPALSGDGRRVAFLTQSAPRGQEAVAAVDLFITDMSPGVSRKAGTAEITREGTSRDPAASGSIVSVMLSADGSRAAIVTPRTRFLLPALKLVGEPRAVPGANELYLFDLATGTTERAVRAGDGSDAGDAVSAQISLSADGTRVAFASAAENLFYGDTNQRTDVFTVDRQAAPPPPPVAEEPPADPPAEAFEAPPAPTRKLTVYVRRAPKGKIRLDVRAPIAGRVTVKVRGRLPDTDGRLRGAARTLAAATKRATKAGRLTIDVPIASRYRASLRRARALDARAEVVLSPTSGTALKREIAVRFSAPKSR
jgi:Tol biopolymer transport system component